MRCGHGCGLVCVVFYNCVVDLWTLQDTHRDVKYDSHTTALASPPFVTWYLHDQFLSDLIKGVTCHDLNL